MMRDDHLRARLFRLAHDAFGQIERDKQPLDRLRRMTGQQPHVVIAFAQLAGRDLLQN